MGKGRKQRKDEHKEKILSKINKAKAMHYDEQEKQRIISGKLVEFVHLQKQYRETFIDLMQLETEIDIMKIELNSGIDNRKIAWYGMTCPDKLLSVWISKKKNQFNDLYGSWKDIESKLLKYGLDKNQVNSIRTEGVYVKELPDKKDDDCIEEKDG